MVAYIFQTVPISLLHKKTLGSVSFYKNSQLSIAESTRGKVFLAQGKEANSNPNPAKWFNKIAKGQFPVTANYSMNIAQAYQALSPEAANRLSTSKKLLEVDSPLNTDDLGQMINQIQSQYPQLPLVQVDTGYEHAVDPNFKIDCPTDKTPPCVEAKEMRFPSLRLVFDASEITEADQLKVFKTIENYHSYKVPVMRFYSKVKN